MRYSFEEVKRAFEFHFEQHYIYLVSERGNNFNNQLWSLTLKEGKRSEKDNSSVKYYSYNYGTNKTITAFKSLKQIVQNYDLEAFIKNERSKRNKSK